MGLRERVMKSIQKAFGKKKITSTEEISSIDSTESELMKNVISEFDESLKVGTTPTLEGNLFSEIAAEARNNVLMNLHSFKNTVLSSEQVQKLQGKEARTGQAGNVPFVCVAEMDENGKIKSTIIVTDQACSKLTVDKDGKKTYQESRFVDGEMKTVINDEKNGSLFINGNVKQSDIDKIKNFASKNKEKTNEMRKFDDQEEKKAYLHILKQRGVDTKINPYDKDKYSYASSGRIIRGKEVLLKEADFVFDKTNENAPPVTVSLNTLKAGKVSRQKYRLTADGKYIDENSFKLDENGNPSYIELTLEELKEQAMEAGFDMDYMNRFQKHQAQGKEMIPQGAIDIHEALVEEKKKQQEREQNQDGQEQQGQAI